MKMLRFMRMSKDVTQPLFAARGNWRSNDLATQKIEPVKRKLN